MTPGRLRRGSRAPRRPRAGARRLRIGVLGGSFDPVHVGHLILAESAISFLSLDELILVPAGQPAHKRRRRLATANHRVAMLRLAARGNRKLRVSRIEVDRPGVTFTVRTLESLTRSREADWYFLMGVDNLRDFGSWREPDTILELARLAVVRRAPKPGATGRTRIPGRRGRVVIVPMPLIEISSSEIRRRVRRRATVRYWVPDAVLSYMERHGIYRNGRSGRT